MNKKKIRSVFLLIACTSILLLTLNACRNTANNGNNGDNGNAVGDADGDVTGDTAGEATDDTGGVGNTNGNNAGNMNGSNAGNTNGSNADNTNEAGETYSAKAQGYGGDVVVTVMVNDGMITSVEAAGENETPEVGGNAIAAYNDDGFTPIIGSDVDAASSDDIDAVSGATATSTAIKTALDAALGKAK